MKFYGFFSQDLHTTTTNKEKGHKIKPKIKTRNLSEYIFTKSTEQKREKMLGQVAHQRNSHSKVKKEKI